MGWFIKLLSSIFGKKTKKEITKVETPQEVVEEKVIENPVKTEKEKVKITVDEILKVKKEQDDKLFEKTLPLVLKYEGGYVNDPDDPGGETNKGIIKTTYDKYRKNKGLPVVSVKEITDEEIEDIYRNNYWLRGSCNKLFDDLAVIHFDACVNTGITQASKFLQRSCGAVDDGKIGPNTLKAVATVSNKAMVEMYFTQRKDFYENLAQRKPKLKKFLKGWLKRVAHLEQHIKNEENDNNKISIV